MPTGPSEVLSTTLAPARGSPDFKTCLHTATAVSKVGSVVYLLFCPTGALRPCKCGNTTHTLLPRLRFTKHIGMREYPFCRASQMLGFLQMEGLGSPHMQRECQHHVSQWHFPTLRLGVTCGPCS